MAEGCLNLTPPLARALGERRAGSGAVRSKGPRVDDCAWARLPYEIEAGAGQWLLLRRSVSDPTAVAFSRVFGPEGPTLETVARVAGTRWVIEEGVARQGRGRARPVPGGAAGTPGTATSASACWLTPSWW